MLPWRFRLAAIMAETSPGRLLRADAEGRDADYYIVDTPERLVSAILAVFKCRAKRGLYKDDGVAVSDGLETTPRAILDYLLSRATRYGEGLDLIQAIIPTIKQEEHADETLVDRQ